MDFGEWFSNNTNIIANVIALATTIVACISCWFSYKSAKATHAQVEEMRRQYEESSRPNIEVEFLYERRCFYGLRFVNHGGSTAQHVKIDLDQAFVDSIKEAKFVDLLRKQKGKECVIGIGQHYDLYFGTNEYRSNQNKVPAKGIITYIGNGISYTSEFFIDLLNYSIIFTVDTNEDKLIKVVKEYTAEIKKIRCELQRIFSLNGGLNDEDSEPTIREDHEQP